MAGYRHRPSKPHAVLIAVLASAMMIFGIAQFVRSGQFHWFHVVWATVGVGIVAATLRQSFGSRSGRGTPVELDDDGNRLRGSANLWGLTADRADAPDRYTLRPSKPMAIVSAIGGVAMLAFGVVQIRGPFLILWVIFLVGIVGFNLWSAFSPRGASSVLERRD